MRVIIISLIALIALAFYASSSSAHVCRSTGDPHYKTFSGLARNLYGDEGDYLFAQDNKNHLKVVTRVRYGQFWSTRGINTAVAVKADRNIVEHFGSYYKINGKKNAPLKLKHGAKISVKGKRWIVTTKSGLNTEFHYYKINNKKATKKWPEYHFSVYVRVPSAYKGKMRGLCGTYKSKSVDTNIWKKFKTLRIAQKSRNNIFDVRFRPKHSPKRFRKAVWKSIAFKKKAQSFCKKMELSPRLYKNCIFDCKISGELNLSKEYKNVTKEVKKLKQVRKLQKANKKGNKVCVKFAHQRTRMLNLAKTNLAKYKLNLAQSKQHHAHAKRHSNSHKQFQAHHKASLAKYKLHNTRARQYRKSADTNKAAANKAYAKYKHHLKLSNSFKLKARKNVSSRNAHLSKARKHAALAKKYKALYLKRYNTYKQHLGKYNHYMIYVRFYKRGYNEKSKAHRTYFRNKYHYFLRLANRYKSAYQKNLIEYKKLVKSSNSQQAASNANNKVAKQQNAQIPVNNKQAAVHQNAAKKNLNLYKKYHLASKNFLKASKSNSKLAFEYGNKAQQHLLKIKAHQRAMKSRKEKALKHKKLAEQHLKKRNSNLKSAAELLKKYNKCRRCVAHRNTLKFHKTKAAFYHKKYLAHKKAQDAVALKIKKNCSVKSPPARK